MVNLPIEHKEIDLEKLDLTNALDEIDLVLTITISAFDAEINEQHLRLLKDSITLSQRKLSAILQQLELLSQG